MTRGIPTWKVRKEKPHRPRLLKEFICTMQYCSCKHNLTDEISPSVKFINEHYVNGMHRKIVNPVWQAAQDRKKAVQDNKDRMLVGESENWKTLFINDVVKTKLTKSALAAMLLCTRSALNGQVLQHVISLFHILISFSFRL